MEREHRAIKLSLRLRTDAQRQPLKLDFQMYILPDAAPSGESDRIRSLRRKIEQDFPIYAAVTNVSGDIVTYTMNSIYSTKEFDSYYGSNGGVSPNDILNQVDQQRSFIDDNINEGEMYLLATE